MTASGIRLKSPAPTPSRRSATRYIVLLFSDKQVATHTVSALLAGHKVRRPPMVLELPDPDSIRRTILSEQRRTRGRSFVIIQSLCPLRRRTPLRTPPSC